MFFFTICVNFIVGKVCITFQFRYFERLLRGGGYSNSTDAGVFYFNSTVNLGGPNVDKSFRLVNMTMIWEIFKLL